MKIRKNGAKIGVLYGRVSVDDAAQVEHGSLEQQEHMGREFVKQISERIGQRMEVPYILIEEKGVSGATTKRPKYQELLRLIISEKIDFIVAKEISRLNRSIEDFLQLMRLCQQHNVALHIKGLDVDPHTPWGKMLFTFMGMLAELERDMVVNRTRESLRSAAINNAKINGGSIPLGFDRHPTSKGYYIVNAAEMDRVRHLMECFLETGSLKQTIEEANRKLIKNKNGSDLNYNSLGRLLRNEKYIGLMRVQMGKGREPKVVQLTHGCPIPRDLFERVRTKLRTLEEFRIKNRVGTRIYLLSSILRFEDGPLMSGSSGVGRSGERHHYYRAKGLDYTLDADAIEKAVLQQLRNTFERDDALESCITKIESDKMNELELLNAQIRSAESQLRTLLKNEDELAKVLMNGASATTVSFVDERIKDSRTQREDWESKLARLQRDRDSLASTKADSKRVRSILARAFAAGSCLNRVGKKEEDIVRYLGQTLSI